MEAIETVVLDPAFLRNILVNLLSNALKYSPEETTVQLSLSQVDHRLKIEVKDEGMGIPQKDQERMFSRFFRAENVSNIEGTGLGMNIVKKYVDLMQGDIKFESVVEKGTTFFVDLPLNMTK